MLHSSGSRLERQSAESAIGWWWPAVAEVDGNEIAAHLAGPARKTSSSQTVFLLFARDDTAFKLYNTIKVVALAAFKSRILRSTAKQFRTTTGCGAGNQCN